jgi:hypothetical protein
MTIFVSLGPSLSREDARRILPTAEFIPPVKAGDILALMDRKPSIIAIIDGVFEQVPAVWHKEILYALSHGVHVFGASSMGALRAAELHAFGMCGVGEVFERYRDGEYTADDEVALLHGPVSVGYAARSEALVNIRAGLRRAEAANVISAGSHASLLKHARDRFYPDRSWPQLLADGRAAGVSEKELSALEAFVSSTKPNVKRDDAIALLERLAGHEPSSTRPYEPTFEFERTVYVDALHKRIANLRRTRDLGTDPREEARLLAHARVTDPMRLDGNSPLLLALFFDLLYAEASRRDMPVASSGHQSSGSSEIEAARRLAIRVIGARAETVSAFLPFALLASGNLSSALEAFNRKQRWALERGAEAVNEAVEALSDDDVLVFCRQRLGIDEPTVAACCAALGISNPAEFLHAVAVQIAFERSGA